MNGVHDMGGMHGFGPIVRDELVFHADWEKRVHALRALSRRLGIFNIDEGRHAIERMAPAAYLDATYYERWADALETSLVDKGVLDRAEIDARVVAAAQVGTTATGPVRELPPVRANELLPRAAGPAPRFRAGDAIITLNTHPAGHTRLPRYARARRGSIDRYYGNHVFADAHAHGAGEQPLPLYCVRFEAAELWGPSADGRGAVYLDLWESYLEEAS